MVLSIKFLRFQDDFNLQKQGIGMGIKIFGNYKEGSVYVQSSTFKLLQNIQNFLLNNKEFRYLTSTPNNTFNLVFFTNI